MKIFLFSLSVLLFGGYPIGKSPNGSAIENKVTLLAGTSSKDWKVSAFSSDADPSICNSSSAVLQDDTYTFYTDGTYKYDAGELLFLSGDECVTDESAIGSWNFNESKDSLLIVIHDKQNSYGLTVLTVDSMVVTSSAGFWSAFVSK